MAARRRRFASITAALAVALPGVLGAQDAYIRGMDLEQAGKYRDAASAFRAALPGVNGVAAMLGLERAYAALGWTDSMVAVIDSAIRVRPAEVAFRGIQMRTLQTLGRSDSMRDAFERWAGEFPREAAPYREYARMLIAAGRAQSADTILQRAQRALGGTRDLQMELAQTRAALGLWVGSAEAWRAAVREAAYLDRAAVFALTPTPFPVRDSIRMVLTAVPVERGARQILASLELGWGAPRAAWIALRDLPAGDSVAVAWTAFADHAEAVEAWLPARDALSAVIDWKMSPELAVRAAEAALRGGEPRSALSLAERASAGRDSASVAKTLALVLVRSLGALGRPDEAVRVADGYARWLSPEELEALRRELAWAWVRTGDVARARQSLTVAGTEEEAAEVTGWLALYEGNLQEARSSLRGGVSTPDAVLAMSLLARTRVNSSPDVGRAFLELARRDTVAAAAAFERAGPGIPDATSLLLAIAARLRASRGETAAAIALWQQIAERHLDTPEAAEANLDWARSLRRAGDNPGAIRRLEHLIITYPQSALVPQARRELDLARRIVPPPVAVQ